MVHLAVTVLAFVYLVMFGLAAAGFIFGALMVTAETLTNAIRKVLH